MGKNRTFRLLVTAFLLVASMLVPASAAPAISNGSFSGGTTDWMYFSGGGVINQNTNSLITGHSTAGLVLGTNASTAGVSTIWSAVGRAGAPSPPNFMTAFSNTAAISGAYQAFNLVDPNGTISFSMEYFATANSGADPFVFLYNQDTDDYIAIRGNATASFNGTSYSTNTMPGATVTATGGLRNATGSPAGALPSGTTNSFGERTVSFANLISGNYVIGFGVGVGSSTAGTFGIAVTNIVSPNNVPEIDTASAGLPVAIVLMMFCLIADRRRQSSVQA